VNALATASITVRIDEALKQQMEDLCADVGMNLSTAYVLFTKAAIRQWKIPFEIAGDPFYCETNQKRLADSIQEGKQGNFITKSMDELKALSDE
jgi:DNA-damage-inducible protein J